MPSTLLARRCCDSPRFCLNSLRLITHLTYVSVGPIIPTYPVWGLSQSAQYPRLSLPVSPALCHVPCYLSGHALILATFMPHYPIQVGHSARYAMRLGGITSEATLLSAYHVNSVDYRVSTVKLSRFHGRHAHIRAHAYAHTHTPTHAHMRPRAYTRADTRTHTHAHAHIRTRIHGGGRALPR